MADATETENLGMYHTFYAKEDGGLATAGAPDEMLSPTTWAWLYFMKANPGASYPDVMNDF